MVPHIRSHSAVFMLPKKGVLSAVIGTVCRWCQDYTAGLEESSTGEVPRLQKFCLHNSINGSRHHARRNASWPQRALFDSGWLTAGEVDQLTDLCCYQTYLKPSVICWCLVFSLICSVLNCGTDIRLLRWPPVSSACCRCAGCYQHEHTGSETKSSCS